MNARNVTVLGLLSAVISSIFWSGCSRGLPRVEPPAINASAAGKDAVKEFDANGDGKISGKELEKVPSLQLLSKKHGDAVTADNITERIEWWQNVLKTGRQPFSCSVLHNGQPLKDAKVQLEPEKFLGTKMLIAEGTTDTGGVCTLSVPCTQPGDMPGVPLGFYRVKITKSGENIPPKYNTQTVLGIEFSNDNEELRMGVQYKLQY